DADSAPARQRVQALLAACPQASQARLAELSQAYEVLARVSPQRHIPAVEQLAEQRLAALEAAGAHPRAVRLAEAALALIHCHRSSALRTEYLVRLAAPGA